MAKAINGAKGKPGGLRRGLMLYGSTAALAAALMLAEGGLAPALAQDIGPRISPNVSAQGDFTVPGPSPSPSFEYRSGNLDIIRMRRDAVLNWTTYDSAPPGGAQGNSYVNFLPANTELRFVGEGQSFTAVNRVFTTPDQSGAYRGIAIQGQVTSYLFGDGPNSVGPVGGNVWFYSPGGILATGSSSFNVGSLVLSASNIDDYFERGSYRYAYPNGVADPFASVIIQPGARITLTQPGSTFAVIAPTIEQGGSVSVNGSTLYMSAEQGYFSAYDNGQLYGAVYVEAQPGNRIHHSGITTGPASLGTDDGSVYDYQTIEFRTGADVDALLSGSIGYAGATDAARSANGTIILSVGGRAASEGNLTLTSSTTGDVQSLDLHARAGETITVGSDANGGYNFVARAAEASVTASAGGRIDIAGDLSITGQYSGARDFTLALESASGNFAGGRIDVGGDLVVDASTRDYYASGQPGSASVTIANGGRLSVAGDMKVMADGAVTENNGVISSVGGDASLTMTGANASLSVGNLLVLSAEAQPFSNCECTPNAGSAQGGMATFTATGGTISVGGLSVSADAEANASPYVDSDAVTDATGGTALVDLGDSIAALGNVVVSTRGIGADGIGTYDGGSDVGGFASFGAGGGAGQNAGGQGGYPGDGGAAFGGTASFRKGSGGSLSAFGLTVTAAATGGTGSEPYEGSAPGSGGNAQGGTAAIVLGQSVRDLSYLELGAEATGGDGGSAEAYYDLDGGRGGDAAAGTASLTLTGANTVLSGISEGSISIAAYGGEGGDGAEDYYSGVQSGDGGRGGSAMAGMLTITAAGGAEYQSEVNLSVSALGGDGGRGGNAVNSEGGPGDYGLGGDGGDATGGMVSLVADGATISGNLSLDVSGQGGRGGLHGYDVFENIPGGANYGAFTGGSIALATTDNGPSRFNLGRVTLTAGGDRSGAVTITHAATDPDAQMHFGQLYVTATGDPGSEVPAFLLSAVNTVTMDSAFQIGAGSIALEFNGIGAVRNGGTTSLSSFSGPITITHADNPGVISLDSAGDFSAGANGDYVAGPGTIVRGGGDEFTIYAQGSITAADSRASGSMTMNAQGNVTVGDVLVGSGYYSQGDFNLYAGRIEFDGPHGYVPTGNALITGTVEVAGSVLVEAGGMAEFAAGSQVLADNDIWVRTGDDIMIANGATFESDIDPVDLESIHLLAGDINVGQASGDLIDPIATPIASLVIGGSLETNGGALYLSGDAIDASGSTITTGDLTADVTDAPPPLGPFSNDGGLLAPDCRQGSACFGTVNASGNVAIGLASNGDLVSLKMGAIEFVGAALDVLARDRIEIGVVGTGSLLAGDTRVALESLAGTVSLTEVTVDSSSVAIRAGGSIDAASSVIQSPNDILLQVGSDITVGTINTGGKLDDGTGSPTFVVPGNFTVRSLSYGGSDDIRIDADGAISVTFADPGAAGIEMVAGGDLYLGNTGPDTGAIRLDGTNVSFNNLVANGVVYLTASADISGISVFDPVIDTTSGIALEADGTVSVLGLQARTDIAISGASVSTGVMSAGGSIGVTAQGDAIVDGFTSGGSTVISGASVNLGNGSAGSFLAVQATEGDISFGSLSAATSGVLQASGALLGGDIAVGGGLSLEGARMAIGNASGGEGIAATIGGDSSFTSLTSSSGSITLDVAGNITGELIDAALDIGITGGLVGVDEITAGGDLLVDSFNIGAEALSAGGDMNLALDGGAFIGEAVAGGDLTLTAGLGITADLLDAGGELFVNSDTPAAIGEAVAGTDLTINASILQTTSLVAGGSIEVNAGAGATIDEAVAGTDFSFTGSELTAGSISAGNLLDVAVSLNATIGSFVSGSDASITGRSLDIGSGSVGGNLTARASEGALDYAVLSVGGDAQLLATGDLSGGDIIAGGTLSLGGADIAVGNAAGDAGIVGVATGTLTFTGVESEDGVIALQADGALTGGSAEALGGITLDAASIALASATSGEGLLFTARSGGISASGLLSAGNTVELQAAQGIAIRSVDALGDITMSAGAEARFVEVRSRAGSVAIDADGAITGSSVAAAGLNAAGEDNVSLAAGGAITLDGAVATLNPFSRAQDDFIVQAGGAVTLARAEAGRDLTVTAGAGTLNAANLASGRDLSLTGPAVQLGSANVVRNLTVNATGGNLGFTNLLAGANADLRAIAALAGGDVDAGGTLSLRGNGLTVGTAAGDAGLTAVSTGAASFTSLASSAGSVSLDAVAGVIGGTLLAGNAVTIVGSTVALNDATFGSGLSLTARTGGLSGTGLYQGTGAVTLSAAQGIAIGSVDTLGGIAMTAGEEARFVELRSRDGSVGVNAGGAITGSSAAATGSDLAGDDSVSLVAGGAITLDGATNTLNPVSRAQDDFTARASGAIAIVRAEAGRDLSLEAGAGTVGAANVVAGRDLSLSGQSVDLVAGTVARNLTARATAGNITGSGLTTAGGAIDLDASGNVAVGSLQANGGTLTVDAGGSIGFAALGASGAVTLTAGTGIAGTGDIVSAADVTIATDTGATTLDDIESGGAVALSGGGVLTMGDIAQNANGTLSISYDGAISLGNAASATSVDIAGGADVGFGSIRTPGAIAIDASGGVSGGALEATNGIDVSGASMALDSVAVGEGDARLQTFSGALSAGTVSAYNVFADSDGTLTLGTVNASQRAQLTGASLSLGDATAGTDLLLGSESDITADVLTAGDGLQAVAGFVRDAGEGGSGELVDGDIAFTSASAGGSAFLWAGGAVTGGTLAAGGFASVEAVDAIALAGLDSGNAELRSSDGAVSASGIAVDNLLRASGTALTLAGTGALTVEAQASAGGIGITTGGNLTVEATATGNIALASTGGSVIITSVGQSQATHTGIGAQSVGGGGAVAVTAANGITVVDSVSAGGALSMTAGGLVSLDGSARGQTIAIQGGDLAIGSGGSLGSADTQRISLASTNAVNLGAGASGGFAVDTAEFSRIQNGGDLMISALTGNGTGAGSLTVGSLTVNAGSGGQLGASGTFGLSAAGVLDVNNTLSIARGASGSTLMLTGDTVDLDYANAALSVLDSAGAATGRIGVTGRLITSMSGSAATDIVGRTPAEISTRLGQADTTREIGLFRTGTLTLQGGDAILIQNSGASTEADDRRGLTVGALNVSGAADGRTLVVINGVIDSTTGITAAGRVTVTGALADGSTVNGCLLSNIAGCLVIPDPEPPLILAPESILFGTSDLIESEEEDDEVEDGVADGKPEAPPIDTSRIDDPAGLPMIDDPVTGAGNEDLWQPPDE